MSRFLRIYLPGSLSKKLLKHETPVLRDRFGVPLLSPACLTNVGHLVWETPHSQLRDTNEQVTTTEERRSHFHLLLYHLIFISRHTICPHSPHHHHQKSPSPNPWSPLLSFHSVRAVCTRHTDRQTNKSLRNQE